MDSAISLTFSSRINYHPALKIGRVDEAVKSVALAKGGSLSDEDVKILDELYNPKAALWTAW